MRKKILLVVSVLFGLMMINSGLNKFFHYMPMPENLPAPMLQGMTALMQIKWLLPLAGIIEIAAGILFMIPRYRALGAVIILPVMVGIVLFNIVQAPQNIPIALLLFGVNVWAIAEDWKRYLPIVMK